MSLFVDDSATAADMNRITVVALVMCHELVPAVALLVVGAGDEHSHPPTDLIFAATAIRA